MLWKLSLPNKNQAKKCEITFKNALYVEEQYTNLKAYLGSAENTFIIFIKKYEQHFQIKLK